MDPLLLLLRWAHILAAIVAMGGLVFVRFALVPALSDVDAATRDRIHEAIRRRWLPWVTGAIAFLLVSGVVNFLLFNARVKMEGWGGGEWMRYTSYHALFGGKLLLAMGAFYFASALVGRSAGTQWVRDDRPKWLSVTLGLMLGVVLLSGWMRQLHTGPNAIESGGVGMESGRESGREPADEDRRRDGDDGEADRDDRYRDGNAGSVFREPAAGGSASAPAAEPEPAPVPAAVPAQ